MRNQEVSFDYLRYQQLLAEAVDESKRLALIDLLIEERAMRGSLPSMPPSGQRLRP